MSVPVATRDGRAIYRNIGIGGAILVLIIGVVPDGYWYCWDRGPASPHHTGSSRTRSDHACSHFEVWFNGNPQRPPGR